MLLLCQRSKISIRASNHAFRKQFSTLILQLPHVHDASNAIPSLHIVECLVDLGQWLPVRNEFVDLELTVHVIVHKTWKLRPTLDAAKGTAFPYTTSYKLEC